MRDIVPSKTKSLTVHGIAGATAILLREYFFALRLQEEGRRTINSLESVKNLLSGTQTARAYPLVQVRMVPGRLDGVFFCRALGQQQTPRGKPQAACRPSTTDRPSERDEPAASG
jgi:hypothetical protein